MNFRGLTALLALGVLSGSAGSQDAAKAAYQARIKAAADAGVEALDKLVREFSNDQACDVGTLGTATVVLARRDPFRAFDTLAAQSPKGRAHMAGITLILVGIPGVTEAAPLWLRTRPDDDAFNIVAGSMAKVLFWKDPLAARQWASEITNPVAREWELNQL